MAKTYSRHRGLRQVDRPPLNFYVILLLILLALAGGITLWFVLHPQGLSSVLNVLSGGEPRVASLTVSVNGTPVTLIPGQTHVISPDDSLAFQSFSSNRPFNYGLRLYSPDLDILAWEKPRSLSSSAPDFFLKPREVRVQVKEGETVLARFILLAKYTSFDLAAKADRAGAAEDKIKYLSEALLIDPDNRTVKLKLADLFENKGDAGKAVELYEDLARQEPTPEIFGKLITIYKQTGNDQKYISTYYRLIRISPRDEAVGYLDEIARYQEEKGMIDGAIQAYEDLKALLPENERLDVYKKLGYLYAQRGRKKESIRSYEQAAALDRTDPNVFYNLARLYREAGDQGRYAANLEKALKLNPSDRQSGIELAEAMIALGRNGEAEAELRKILAAEPSNVQARLLLIKLMEKKGDKAALIKEYEFLSARDPKNKVLLFNLGVLYFEAGQLEKAEQRLTALALLDPADLDARQHLFEVLLGLEKKRKAYDLALELIDRSPGFDRAYEYVFDYLDAKKDYKTLAAQAGNWTGKRPGEVKFWEYLAYAHAKLDKLDLVAGDYEAILKLRPRDLKTTLKLAALYEGLGDIGSAKKTYERALEIDPDNEEAARAVLRLSFEQLEKTRREKQTE